jgi:hypothetical protein
MASRIFRQFIHIGSIHKYLDFKEDGGNNLVMKSGEKDYRKNRAFK